MVSPGEGRHVAVVTDSTASLPPGLIGHPCLTVVPLYVVVDGVTYREGVDLAPDQLLEALRSGARVSTSQPGPEVFARAYARAAARGAREIVSVHLSGDLSGTVDSAGLAAQTTGVPVKVVDSRTVGMGLGFAVLAAVLAATEGSDTGSAAHGAAVARAARSHATSSTVHFAVDTLEHLRRGGRLGAVSAAVGTVLGLRPVLAVVGGRIDVVEKVRTSERARTRVVELAAQDVAVRRSHCDVAVHHVGDPDLGRLVADRLVAVCGNRLGRVEVAEISAVVAAHVGPGLVAVVVTDTVA
ncbi:DegV family protein [Actinotalea sp. K2]|uniref:DegV family protein n=1 Tax=Actinotalea sp. K2 TaxID=2939438 RepID=UPI0020174599|nr:DegV family protein [Actinotalea sp. K2]MCL3860577.1 DegV family protein [Actinotalea sp. K2]